MASFHSDYYYYIPCNTFGVSFSRRFRLLLTYFLSSETIPLLLNFTFWFKGERNSEYGECAMLNRAKFSLNLWYHISRTLQNSRYTYTLLSPPTNTETLRITYRWIIEVICWCKSGSSIYALLVLIYIVLTTCIAYIHHLILYGKG